MKRLILSVVLCTITSALDGYITITQIINLSKTNSIEIEFPWQYACQPKVIRKKKVCLLEQGSPTTPIVRINLLNQDNALVIDNGSGKFSLYYGTNKVGDPCICILDQQTNLIYRDGRANPDRDPQISLLVRDNQLPQIHILSSFILN